MGQDLTNSTFKEKFRAAQEICNAECAAQHLAKTLDHGVKGNWHLHLLYYINSTPAYNIAKDRGRHSSFVFVTVAVTDYQVGLQTIWEIIKYLGMLVGL